MPDSLVIPPPPVYIGSPLGVEQGAPYTIVGPDGTRAAINQPLSIDNVGYLTAPPTGLERAGVRENADTLPGADGGIHGAFLRDRLPFTLAGVIPPDVDVGGTWLERQDRLLRATDAMSRDAFLLWAPSEAPPVMVAFREQQPTRIGDRRPKTFLVAGVCEDPVVVSQELHSAELIPGALGGGGFRSPLVSPLVSGAAEAGELVVTNLGRGLAWPVLTIHGPCLNPVVTNQTAGAAIYLNFELGVGEFMTIYTNPRRRAVRLNDVANRYGAYDFARSAWWAIRPGHNDVAIGFTSYTAGARLVIEWRDTWG